MNSMMPIHYQNGDFSGMGPFGFWLFGGVGWLFMLVFWILVILALAGVVRWLFSVTGKNSKKSPLDILKERYAKGEIDKREFEDKRREVG